MAETLIAMFVLTCMGATGLSQTAPRPGSVGDSWNKSDVKSGQAPVVPKGPEQAAPKQSAMQKSWDAVTPKDPRSWRPKQREPERKPAPTGGYFEKNLVLLDSLDMQQCLSTGYLKELRARNAGAPAVAESAPKGGAAQKGDATAKAREALHQELVQLLNRCMGRGTGPQYR